MPILSVDFEPVDFEPMDWEPMDWESSVVLEAGLDREDRRQRRFVEDPQSYLRELFEGLPLKGLVLAWQPNPGAQERTIVHHRLQSLFSTRYLERAPSNGIWGNRCASLPSMKVP